MLGKQPALALLVKGHTFKGNVTAKRAVEIQGQTPEAQLMSTSRQPGSFWQTKLIISLQGRQLVCTKDSRNVGCKREPHSIFRHVFTYRMLKTSSIYLMHKKQKCKEFS